jgi:hypothetical protein
MNRSYRKKNMEQNIKKRTHEESPFPVLKKRRIYKSSNAWMDNVTILVWGILLFYGMVLGLMVLNEIKG